MRQRLRVDVAAEQRRRRRRRTHAVAGALADPLPRRTVEPGELLETEGTPEARCTVRGAQRGLDDDRAAAAHGVEQRRARRPAGQREQAGGEVLAQRRRVGIAPVAALEQRLARGVEIERRLAVGEVGVDADVGTLLVDRGPRAAGVAETVADGVLHLQRRKLEARQRRARGGEVDAQRALDAEVGGPVDALHQPVEVVFVAIAAVRHLPEDPARQPRLEVGEERQLARTREGDAAFGRGDELRSQRTELVGERGFEAARAGGEEAVDGRGQRRALAAVSNGLSGEARCARTRLFTRPARPADGRATCR